MLTLILMLVFGAIGYVIGDAFTHEIMGAVLGALIGLFISLMVYAGRGGRRGGGGGGLNLDFGDFGGGD